MAVFLFVNVICLSASHLFFLSYILVCVCVFFLAGWIAVAVMALSAVVVAAVAATGVVLVAVGVSFVRRVISSFDKGKTRS